MQPAPASKGDLFSQIDTPALVIDMDAFERNLQRMADMLKDKPVRLRAHAKTHKSPIITQMQMTLGAVGACCQKVSEADALINGGVPNVLVSNEVIGEEKLARLARLTKRAEWLGLCIDSTAGLEQASRAAANEGVTVNALVEIDVGAGRCGVKPGAEAVALAKRIEADPHLSFAGLQAYHGSAQHIRAFEDRKAAIDKAVSSTRETVDMLQKEGLECTIVGGAGTGTFEFESSSGVYNEIQAGSYIFMDADYARNRAKGGGAFDTFEHALFILATVMSSPAENRAVVDAGHKAASIDSGMPEPYQAAGMTYDSPSDEHGVLRMEGSNRLPRIGEQLLLIPGHCDPTVNLHDWYICVRELHTDKAYVEDCWPVAARGAYF